jgi:hypothetical protein
MMSVIASLIHSLPTFPATPATPQSAAVIAGCDRTSNDEEKRSLIHSLPTSLATPATPQSAAVIVGCDRLQPILDTDIAATCTVTNSAGFLTAIKQTGELQLGDSTALLPTTLRDQK